MMYLSSKWDNCLSHAYGNSKSVFCGDGWRVEHSSVGWSSTGVVTGLDDEEELLEDNNNHQFDDEA